MVDFHTRVCWLSALSNMFFECHGRGHGEIAGPALIPWHRFVWEEAVGPTAIGPVSKVILRARVFGELKLAPSAERQPHGVHYGLVPLVVINVQHGLNKARRGYEGPAGWCTVDEDPNPLVLRGSGEEAFAGIRRSHLMSISGILSHEPYGRTLGRTNVRPDHVTA